MASEQQLKITSAIKKLFISESNNYIFIYTPPKVGSTTLVSSLRISLSKSYNIIHIHDEIMLAVLTGIQNISINDIIQYLASNGKKVFVIDVYRTPVERKMSEFFEKISPYHFNNSEEKINYYSINRVSDRFNKIFPHIENDDHYFEKYNIDNPLPFDFENKYTIQIINDVSYIKLRLCDSHIWHTILSNIFKMDIVLITDYQTETKKIGELYKRFKFEYKLPRQFLELIQKCKYFNFYYNEEERNKYLDSWRSRLSHSTFQPYTIHEFKFYIQICLENQYINDIQVEHYIDNGCFCKYCSVKRQDIYFRAKNGQKRFDKINHKEVIHELNEGRTKMITQLIKTTNTNKKYRANQFSIHLK